MNIFINHSDNDNFTNSSGFKITLLLYFLALGIAFFVSGIIIKIKLLQKQNSTQPRLLITQEKKLVLSKFSSLPPEKFYSWFIERYKALNISMQNSAHLLAHTVGRQFYITYGIDGIVYCDNSFQYGCFHGFTEEATKKNSKDESLREIEVACEKSEKSVSNCIHGIGHGLLELSGYKRKNLDLALSQCESSLKKIHTSDCYSGVFMQYNRRVNEDLYPQFKVLGLRSFSDKKPYEPCDTVNEQYAFSCYQEIPFFWASHLAKNNDALHIISSLCNDIQSVEYQTNCYLSLGSIGILQSHMFDNKEYTIIPICLSGPNKYSILRCLQGAIRTLRYYNSEIMNPFCEAIAEKEYISICEKEKIVKMIP